MRWPWTRRRPDTSEADRHLDRLRRQEPEVRRYVSESERAQRENHFADLIRMALRGAR